MIHLFWALSLAVTTAYAADDASVLEQLLAVDLGPSAVRPSVTAESARGVRPLDDAARVLARRCGWVIAYEEAPPLPSRRRRALGDGTVLEWEVAIRPGCDSIEETLTDLLRSHDENGNPGRYEVHHQGFRYWLTPTHVQRPDGEWREVEPLLGTMISMPGGRAPAHTHINTLLAAIEKESGMRIMGGMIHEPLLHDVELMPQTEVPAEVALAAILNQVGGRYRWSLLRDHRVAMAALNLARVPAAASILPYAE